ncbi:MAG: bifunctional riboflavin kinase/FAD synthetase [Anaerolineales bacterium]|nr:bifunctional riboflavin kinase/FAD synthetase [Anaerolineales bacterium]
MEHFHNITDIQLTKSWLTIGSYDGVHKGHQQILLALVEQAHQNGQPAVVVTFHPHPVLVINEEERPFYLTLPDERAQLLGALGVDIILTYPFSRKTSQTSAREFISLLHTQLHFSQLWIGYDFALGKDREGNSSRLMELGQEFGYSLKDTPPFYMNGELVSSSRIRKHLRDGEIQQAAAFLGRPFEITGKVIKGKNRGKSLGFATSNLDVPQEMVNIKPGVYACWASVQGQNWKAVTNIGFRPTFGDGLLVPLIETHLLGFSGDLYGEDIHLRFIDRLRDEMKFEQVSELQAQVQMDIDKAKHMLGD